MSATRGNRQCAAAGFAEYFRCPEHLLELGVHADMSSEERYLTFGEAASYGRLMGISPSQSIGDGLPDKRRNHKNGIVFFLMALAVMTPLFSLLRHSESMQRVGVRTT